MEDNPRRYNFYSNGGVAKRAGTSRSQTFLTQQIRATKTLTPDSFPKPCYSIGAYLCRWWFLVRVELPESITAIEYCAFGVCRFLKFVSGPNVESISDRAFSSNSQLETVFFPKLTFIGRSAFEGCVSITAIDGTNITEIRENAFYGCSLICRIRMPNVRHIGSGAFAWCQRLTNCYVGPYLQCFSHDMFYNAKQLTHIRIPPGCAIENGAFSSTGLKSVTFSGAPGRIELYAFFNMHHKLNLCVLRPGHHGWLASHTLSVLKKCTRASSVSCVGPIPPKWDFKGVQMVAIAPFARPWIYAAILSSKKLNITLPVEIWLIIGRFCEEY